MDSQWTDGQSQKEMESQWTDGPRKILFLIDRSSIQNNQSIERETSSSLFRLSLSLSSQIIRTYHIIHFIVSYLFIFKNEQIEKKKNCSRLHICRYVRTSCIHLVLLYYISYPVSFYTNMYIIYIYRNTEETLFFKEEKVKKTRDTINVVNKREKRF